jgi:hypothetical protein
MRLWEEKEQGKGREEEGDKGKRLGEWVRKKETGRMGGRMGEW